MKLLTAYLVIICILGSILFVSTLVLIANKDKVKEWGSRLYDTQVVNPLFTVSFQTYLDFFAQKIAIISISLLAFVAVIFVTFCVGCCYRSSTYKRTNSIQEMQMAIQRYQRQSEEFDQLLQKQELKREHYYSKYPSL